MKEEKLNGSIINVICRKLILSERIDRLFSIRPMALAYEIAQQIKKTYKTEIL